MKMTFFPAGIYKNFLFILKYFVIRFETFNKADREEATLNFKKKTCREVLILMGKIIFIKNDRLLSI